MEKIWKWAEQFDSVKYWLKTLANRSEGTKELYVYNFKFFCDYVGKNPDELIKQRDSDLKAKDPRDKYKIENDVKAYMATLERKGESFGSRNAKYAAIRSFFEQNYRKLEGLKRTDAPTGENIGKRIPEKSEVKAAMSVAKCLRDRALISFAKDCGWRIGDIARLNWGDMEDLGDGFWHFKKITQKRKVRAFGFIGPETTKLMKLYRSQRERGTLKGNRGIPPETIRNSSPLFVAQSKGFKPLVVTQMIRIISKAFKDADLTDLSGHSLRKYFETALEDPKLHIRTNWIKRFTGKKISASMEPYVEKRVKKLLEAYKSAYVNLSLEEKTIDERQRRIEAILDNARMLGKSEDEIKNIRTMVMRKDVSVEEVIKMLKCKNETNDCADGEHCERFEEIGESELLSRLQTGWKVAYKLQNGSVIIRKG